MAFEPERFRDPTIPAVAVQHTGGTTKQPLLVQRGAGELAYIDEFFRTVIHELGYQDEAPLCISVLGSFHGDPTPMPYPGPTFKLDVNDDYWDLKTLLSSPKKVIGREIKDIIVVGLESQLRILTCRLIEERFDFSSSLVRSLHSTGDLVTSRLRHFYETTWGCVLSSRYSMSEVVGGAEVCKRCGHYHCDTHIIGEVVDPARGTLITEGVGVLVLTCLYPFVQKQPFIRYRTGDLVKLGPNTCPIDSLAFKLCGRELHSIFDPNSTFPTPLVIGAEVYDVLDDIPDVGLSEFTHVFRSLDGLPDRKDLGHLKYKVELLKDGKNSVLELTVELRYTCYLYPKATEKVLKEIRSRILARHEYLKSRVASGEVLFRVRSALPGRLNHVQVDEAE
ncbi:hypothetical protein GOB34_04230 [Sinorhizobium meliloti]|nr:hypothetical protein [Sinorhizobium meliloti]